MATTKKCTLDPSVWHKHRVGWWGKRFVEYEGNRICTYTVKNDYVWRSYQHWYAWSGWVYSRLKPTGKQLTYPYNKIQDE